MSVAKQSFNKGKPEHYYPFYTTKDVDIDTIFPILKEHVEKVGGHTYANWENAGKDFLNNESDLHGKVIKVLKDNNKLETHLAYEAKKAAEARQKQAEEALKKLIAEQAETIKKHRDILNPQTQKIIEKYMQATK